MVNKQFIRDMINSMTREEKAGALMTLGFAGTVVKPNIYEYITRYHCGGLRLSPEVRTFGAYVDPTSGRQIMDIGDFSGVKYGKSSPVCRPSDYKAILQDLQKTARARRHGIPLHFSTDMEGGSSTDPLFNEMQYFPKPMGIRAANEPELAYQVALAQGRQLRAMGINWIHSPVLDVNSNPKNPEIYNRSYSDDAEVVLTYARETCRGFRDAGVIATGKHFPGRGSSDVDAHFNEPVLRVSREDLEARDLLPYAGLIKEGLLPAVMIAHTIFTDVDPEYLGTVSKTIITDLLRAKLGFDGVVTSDSMTMGGIIKNHGVAEGCVLSLIAGADLVLMKAETHLVEDTYGAILKAITDGRLSEADVDAKLTRILSLKAAYGLFDPANDSVENPDEVCRTEELRQLAAEVAGKSLCVYRGETLPVRGDDPSVVVIEQKIKHYNLLNWHSGQLYEHILKHNPRARYLETEFSYDQADLLNIKKMAESYDTIIMTSYFLRGNRGNLPVLRELLEQFPDKRFIFIANTPYETLTIPEGAENALVTFSMVPETVLNAADVIFGKGKAGGTWPVSSPQRPILD